MSKSNFKERFKDKISVVNKDGSSTHMSTGNVTRAPVPVSKADGADVNQAFKRQLMAQIQQQSGTSDGRPNEAPAPQFGTQMKDDARPPSSPAEDNRPPPKPAGQSMYHALRANANKTKVERPRPPGAIVVEAEPTPAEPEPYTQPPAHDDFGDAEYDSDGDVPTFGRDSPKMRAAAQRPAPKPAMTLKQREELRKAKPQPKHGRRAQGAYADHQPSSARGRATARAPAVASEHFIPDPEVGGVQQLPPPRAGRHSPAPDPSPVSPPPARATARPAPLAAGAQATGFAGPDAARGGPRGPCGYQGPSSPATTASSEGETPAYAQRRGGPPPDKGPPQDAGRRRAQSSEPRAKQDALLEDDQGPGYTPYTLQDFKKINHSVKMGALGYADTEEKRQGRQMRNRLKEYSQGVRYVNQAPAQPAKPKPILPTPNPEKDLAMQKRLKALEFAANVPKPKLKHRSNSSPSMGRAHDEDSLVTAGVQGDQLAALEWQHQMDQDAVAAIKRELKL